MFPIKVNIFVIMMLKISHIHLAELRAQEPISFHLAMRKTRKQLLQVALGTTEEEEEEGATVCQATANGATVDAAVWSV